MEIAKGGVDEYDHSLENVMYVVSNIPGKGINIDDFESIFTIGCSCVNQCNSECTCVRNKVNYIDNFLLNEEKLNDLIFECNSACSCLINNCNNRLIQNGPLNCLKIMNYGDKGFGLLTRNKIKKNQFICEYAGEVIGIDEAKIRSENNKLNKEMNYILVVKEYIGDSNIITCIDPKYFGNIGRYCNHSCQPNAILVPIRIENLTPHLCLFASRDIFVNEEITFDYSGGLNNLNCISETPCLCGTDNCIGFLPHQAY